MKVIVSSVLFLAIASCYLIWKLTSIKESWGDLLKDFVDVSPAVVLLFFSGYPAIVFLMACLVANEFIYDNIIVGAGLFAVGYVLSSLYSVWNPVNFAKMDIAIVTAISIIIIFLSVWKGEKKLKIAAGVYGALTLPILFYAFYVTWNPGFLALAIGDSLLLVGEMFPKNKTVRIVSDLFYFFGTCFVPLSLTGGWL